MIDQEVKDKALEIIKEVISNGHFYISVGIYEGNELYIVDSWECVYHLQGLINGFEGLKDKPYLREDETYHSKGLELAALIKQDPNNWNLKRQKEVVDSWFFYKQYLAANHIDEIALEDVIDFVFNDEYDLCCHCGNNIVRTSPDSYSWTPPLFLEAEGYVCDDCAHNYTDTILEDFCNVEKSIPDQFDTSDLGLVKINDGSYQNGLHYGMDDSPKPIIEKLNAEGIDVWFKVYPSQFNIDFDVYVKESDEERAKDILKGVNTYQGFSSAGNCEKALREATIQMDNLEGEGIKYAKINSDGTAITRLVSPEEFIKGIK